MLKQSRESICTDLGTDIISDWSYHHCSLTFACLKCLQRTITVVRVGSSFTEIKYDAILPKCLVVIDERHLALGADKLTLFGLKGSEIVRQTEMAFDSAYGMINSLELVGE